MLKPLIVVVISQCMCLLKPQVIHLKYITFVSYTLITMEKMSSHSKTWFIFCK